MDNVINPILIIAAVDHELSHLVGEIRNPVHSMIGKRKTVSGNLFGSPVLVLTTGPGMINTAQALTAVLEHVAPFLIIQTGCAGIFKESGGDLGDIGLAQNDIDVQSGIEAEEGSPFIPEPLPFFLLESKSGSIRNNYPVDPHLADNAFLILKDAFKSSGTRVLRGPFITVSTITATDSRAAAYHGSYFPIMESMEGAAAAHVALHYNIPFLEIRAASNRVGKRDKQSWDLSLSFRQCTLAVNQLIKHINQLR